MAAFLGIMYVIVYFLVRLIPAAVIIFLSILLFRKIKNINIENDLFRE